MPVKTSLLRSPLGVRGDITTIAFASPHEPGQDCATRVLTRLLGPCFKTGRIEATTVVMRKRVGVRPRVALTGWVDSQTAGFKPVSSSRVPHSFSPSYPSNIGIQVKQSIRVYCIRIRARVTPKSVLRTTWCRVCIAATPFNCSPHLECMRVVHW